MAIVSRPKFLLSVAFWGAAVCAHSADEPHTSVADLRYGVALYEYFQNRNLEALSELMVAEKQGGIQGHGDNPEIMMGGFYLAYGMEDKAGRIFERLLADNRSQQTQDAAWFYLARLRYMRGDWNGCAQALSKISAHPEAGLADEARALKVNLAIRQGQLDWAATVLHTEYTKETDWLPYLYYNLGTAFSRQQEYQKGLPYLTWFTSMDQRSPEHLALYDKALTAAGFAHLMAKEYEKAVAQFSKVRLDSPMSNRALLGYGWAAVELADYEEALKPWQVLAERPVVDANTQEALVAIPYAYEKMGYTKPALEAFRRASAEYTRALTELDEVVQQMQGSAIREALNIERSTDINWLDYASTINLSPQLTYLVNLFSQESFLSLVKELRDLLAIQTNLNQWQQKLVLYSDMLDEREANRNQELDTLAAAELDQRIAEMRTQRDGYAERIAALQQNTELLALVAEKDAGKLERVERAERNLAQLQQTQATSRRDVMPDEELQQLAEIVRLHRGFMTWQAAQMYDERLWRAERELELANEQLQQLEATRVRIASILNQGFDLQPYRQSIASARQRLAQQSAQVEVAVTNTQNRLRDQVMTALEGERARLTHHLTQARISIARLLDRTAADAAQAAPADEPTEGADNGGDS